MPVTITFEFVCDVCGRRGSFGAGSKRGRSPEGWMVVYGVDPKSQSDVKYLCEIHNVEVHKTVADPSAKTVIRDSKDVEKDELQALEGP